MRHVALPLLLFILQVATLTAVESSSRRRAAIVRQATGEQSVLQSSVELALHRTVGDNEVVELGSRCTVANKVKGIVRFVGKIKSAQGVLYGVDLEEAKGKNDGEINGVRYFTTSEMCKRGKEIPIKDRQCHGVFIPRQALTECTPGRA